MALYKAKLIDGRTVEEGLNGRQAVLLFAAQWCPGCRAFSPLMRELYEPMDKSKYEVVFVSSDYDAEGQEKHFKEDMSGWLQLAHDEPMRQELKRVHGLCAAKEVEPLGVKDRKQGIPSVAVMDPRGEEIVALFDGDDLEKDGKRLDAFFKEGKLEA